MKRKDIKRTIREHFLIHPTSKLRVREIERTLHIPLPSVIRYCKELEEEGILSTAVTGSVRFYTASRNETYRLEKKFFNIKRLYASGLIECLKQELSNPAIIVFGSYAKGEDIENSDIDLYIETSAKKQIGLAKFKKMLQRDIQVFSYRTLKDVQPNLANNIVNGVILNGFIEVFA